MASKPNNTMQYWVEVNHSDLCAICREGRTDCATGRQNQRIRVAQFLYFQEAIDYAQECQRRGVRVWLRKPRYVSFPRERTLSEYSEYPAQDADRTAAKKPADKEVA
jgi:hypothetical protein